MTRIAVITAATNTIERFRIDMIDEFVHRGCDVVVFGNESEVEWRDYFDLHNVRYRRYPVSRNGMNPACDFRTLRSLIRLLREERIDKVFTYQAKPNIYGGMAAHQVGVEQYALMGGLGSVFLPSTIREQLVCSVVTAEYRLAFRRARVVFFQNAEDASKFKNLGIVNSEQIVMLHGSGVNLDKFRQEPLPEKPSFVMIARLVRGKGVIEYLEAARMVKGRYPEVVFHLVGPYDTNPSALKPEDIEPYIEDGTVMYHGEQKDVRPYLAAASCFVLPSYYGEGTPKSGLEALATGRPVIVANAVGCREIVEDEANGYLVEPKNEKALADAMMKLAQDRGLAQRMGQDSRTLAVKKFDVRLVNSTICEAMGL